MVFIDRWSLIEADLTVFETEVQSIVNIRRYVSQWERRRYGYTWDSDKHEI